MVQYYKIAGQQVGSHYLAIGVLTTLFGTVSLLSGGSKKPANNTPPINASNKDEENFIAEFLKNAESEDKKKH